MAVDPLKRAVWMDQGGTFTDVVEVADDGRVRISKHLSDRFDLCAGVGVEARRGTTAATNALLEGQTAPVLLLTNRGLGDLHWIGDGTRPALFGLRQERAPALARAVLEVDGRIAADGAVLEGAQVDPDALGRWFAAGLRCAAVVLVHGPLAPAQERQLGDACRAAGFTTVSLGHQVAPSRGFVARLQTTLADAALSPLLPRAPGLWMTSDGGLAAEDGSGNGEWRGARAMLSGPAGGVVHTAEIARRCGLPRVFGLDLGGTSTDICRVDGAPRRSADLVVGGRRFATPALALETVAAGGGSRLAIRNGVYAVGPESNGAEPGPACYGRGGSATLADCEVVLGRLPEFPAICGPQRDKPLDVEAARRAVAALDPSRPVEEVAAGFQRVAAAEVARAVSRLAAHDGVDPAQHSLVAYGGGGPAHACRIARLLRIRQVVVPALASVASAVGIGMAGRRSERVGLLRPGGTVADALREALAALPFDGAVAAWARVRCPDTQEPLPVPLERVDPSGFDRRDGGPALGAAFRQVHRDVFGFPPTATTWEVVEVRAAVDAQQAPLIDPLAWPPAPAPRTKTVAAWFGGPVQTPVLALPIAGPVAGPALLLGAGATVVVEPGWTARPGPGCLLLDDSDPVPPPLSTAFDPVDSAIFAARLMSVAEHMGERLQRLARSVSIRQRLDFSTAVFDQSGHLLANAPHVPVHLGAMGQTVRALLAAHGDALQAGQCWVGNDPRQGGSHLPDITVMRPVFHRGRRIAFVACRGHHIDVGGSSPGSMPPDATHIDQEGLVLPLQLLADAGGFHPPDLPGCREPAVVRADLRAQIAACALGDSRLRLLVDEVGPRAFRAQQGHLLDQAERAVEAVLVGMPGVHRATEVLDDGTPIKVELRVRGRKARLRVQAPAHHGNLNAPRAVAIAALLYAFRCLVDQPLPLNEGALRPFTLELDPGGLFDPGPTAAVAGGNVETSQRLVDAILRAVGAQAASQGTMNNLTVGTPKGAWYETIGGGGGAGPGFEGTSAVQVHMTNTRATDIEELETRFPVRLLRVERRIGSGGGGQWAGGDGLVKEWLFLAPVDVALLAGRRDAGAPGLDGGEAGARGVDERDVGQGWEPAPPRWTAKAGDKLRISTPGGGGCGTRGAAGARRG